MAFGGSEHVNSSGSRQLQRVVGKVLLLYQMPSRIPTLEATLEGYGLQHSIFLLHFLSRESAKGLERCIDLQEPVVTWKRCHRASKAPIRAFAGFALAPLPLCLSRLTC
jgi:hypothetical protein